MEETPQDIVIVTIDLGDCVKDSIAVKQGESLSKLADDFCTKHSLNPQVKTSIESYLKHTLAPAEPQQPAKAPSKTPPKPRNVGARLYKVGVDFVHQKERRKKQLMEAKAKAEHEQYSFQPTINKGPIPSPAPIKTPTRVRRERPLSLFKECTFAPQIDDKSRTMLKDRTGDTCKRLYAEHQRSRHKKTRSDQVLTPSVTSSAKHINLDESIQRLHTAQSRKRTSQESTESYSFTPVTGRGPSKQRVGNVFSRLHRSRSSSIEPPPPVTQSSFQADTRSTKIVDRIRFHRLKEIFFSLNPQDGRISFATIKTAAVPQEVSAILGPLFDELEETGESLECEEFCGALEALLKVLTPEERHQLIFPRKRRENSIDSPTAGLSSTSSHKRVVQATSLRQLKERCKLVR